MLVEVLALTGCHLVRCLTFRELLWSHAAHATSAGLAAASPWLLARGTTVHLLEVRVVGRVEATTLSIVLQEPEHVLAAYLLLYLHDVAADLVAQ